MQAATEKSIESPTIRSKAHDVAKALQKLRGVAGSKSLHPYANYVLFKKSAEHKDKIYLYAFDGVTQISSWFYIDPKANYSMPDEFNFLVLEKGLPNLLKMLDNEDEISIVHDASTNQVNVCFYENKYTFPCATLDKYNAEPYEDITGVSFRINSKTFYKIIEQLEVVLDKNKNNLYGIFLEITSIGGNQFKLTWMTTDAHFMVISEVVTDTVLNYNENDNKFVINPDIIYSLKNGINKNDDEHITVTVNSKLCSIETESVRLISISPSIKFIPKDIVSSKLIKLYSFVLSLEDLHNSLKRLYSIYKNNPVLNFHITEKDNEIEKQDSDSNKKLMVVNAANLDESITGQDAIEINMLDSKISQFNSISFMANGSALKEVVRTLDEGNYVFTINESMSLGLLERFEDANEVEHNTYVYIALQTN